MKDGSKGGLSGGARDGVKKGLKSRARGFPGQSADAPTIPDKLYFRIGEVAALCRVPTYVLRFWQTEFPQLRPGKSGTGQRLYRRRDVEMALRIKRLLHEEGYTIAGAKGVLADEAAIPAHLRLQPQLPAAADGRVELDARIRRLRGELRELLLMLERKEASPPLFPPGRLSSEDPSAHFPKSAPEREPE